MSEMLKSYLDFVIATGVDPFLFLIFGSFIFFVWYFLSKIYPKRMAIRDSIDKRKIDLEEQRLYEQRSSNEFLKQASLRGESAAAHQFEMLNNNTVAIKTMIDSLNRVKDNVIEQNERTKNIRDSIEQLKSSGLSIGDLNRIDAKLDYIQKNSSSKNDIHHIMDTLSDINNKTSKNIEMLTEIRAKQN